MRLLAGRLLSVSFAFAIIALGGQAARADQAAPAPAAASTTAPVNVNINFQNGTTYSGNATVAYPPAGNVSPSSEPKSIQFVNGKPPSGSYALTLNGPGELTYSDGSKLGGSFVNGVIDGPGEYVKPGVLDFKGTFASGQATTGTVSFANGPTYNGAFEGGLPTGQGMLTTAGPIIEETGLWSKGVLISGYEVFNDGRRLEGTTPAGMSFDSNGKPNGGGVLHAADGTSLSGAWLHGLYAGPIVEHMSDGTVVTVNVAPPDAMLHGAASVAFRNGDRATGALTPAGTLGGRGTYSFHNGPRIRGTFRNGQLDGPASLTALNGHTYAGKIQRGVFTSPYYQEYLGERRTYSGLMDAAGRPNGWGITRFGNGEWLSGTWVHGRMSRKMTDRLPDGTTFSVNVVPPSDVLRGQATVAFPNGDRATAPLESGVLNGPGTYFYVGGNRIDGTFVQGRLAGRATLTTPDGERFVGKMVDGTVQ